ncbi:MAG TPA: hypothetical protein VFO57_12415 [Burkholderiales bacterium]|nr:hypothetical protein [Burkholderiales bacterium]
MKAQAGKSPYLPLLVTGIAIVLFSTGGIARMMGWIPDAIGYSGGNLAPAQALPVPVADGIPFTPRCPECGMIASVREIGTNGEDSGPAATGEAGADNGSGETVTTTRNFEITVLMAGGSNRVLYLSNPANWRPGQRMILIDGANPPRR